MRLLDAQSDAQVDGLRRKRWTAVDATWRFSNGISHIGLPWTVPTRIRNQQFTLKSGRRLQVSGVHRVPATRGSWVQLKGPRPMHPPPFQVQRWGRNQAARPFRALSALLLTLERFQPLA